MSTSGRTGNNTRRSSRRAPTSWRSYNNSSGTMNRDWKSSFLLSGRALLSPVMLLMKQLLESRAHGKRIRTNSCTRISTSTTDESWASTWQLANVQFTDWILTKDQSNRNRWLTCKDPTHSFRLVELAHSPRWWRSRSARAASGRRRTGDKTLSCHGDSGARGGTGPVPAERERAACTPSTARRSVRPVADLYGRGLECAAGASLTEQKAKWAPVMSAVLGTLSCQHLIKYCRRKLLYEYYNILITKLCSLINTCTRDICEITYDLWDLMPTFLIYYNF